ncbi:hypothetical protein [Novosphingobium sp.]|uniref:hypothetical protein n=1 Tax=Novosphingobium sp. TaxID=1874826 RepID=UPI0035AF9366
MVRHLRKVQGLTPTIAAACSTVRRIASGFILGVSNIDTDFSQEDRDRTVTLPDFLSAVRLLETPAIFLDPQK